MMIFHKARLAYLAVPKTATTSIEDALADYASAIFLDPPGLKHSNVRKFNRKLRPIFEQSGKPSLETVAVIREPVDWLQSWFRYRQRPFLHGKRNSTAGMSFADFVTGYLDDTPADYARIGSQAAFLTNDAGQLLVDHLFSYDRLEELVGFVTTRLGVDPVALDHLNQSKRSDDHGTDLPSDLRARLEKVCVRDFELYRAAQAN